jgi:hypothetical protein
MVSNKLFYKENINITKIFTKYTIDWITMNFTKPHSLLLAPPAGNYEIVGFRS